ncbi:MAG: hypothetical protein HC805_02060 [Alkalinema sp. RL_2_19]|nr:hypothetical protein [Alkalinema sp. RL_2_19]
MAYLLSDIEFCQHWCVGVGCSGDFEADVGCCGACLGIYRDSQQNGYNQASGPATD